MAYFSFSSKNPNFPIASASFNAMHTKFEIIVTPTEESHARKMVEEIREAITLIDNKLNRHNSASLISKINNRAGSCAVEIDDELFMILEFCRSFYSSTIGYFDVGACSFLPTETANHGLKYVLNADKHTVMFLDDSLFLDFGGFAKGYALAVITSIIKKYETKNALINFGNSSVMAIGNHPYGEYWPVSVEHTLVKGKEACSFHLKDNALSVSGTRQKEHIYNPHTGQKVKKDSLIAVRGTSSLITEVLSTALYAAQEEKYKEIINNYQGYEAFEIVCLPDGTSEISRI